MAVLTKQQLFMAVLLIALTYPVVFVHYLEVDVQPWKEVPKFSWPSDYKFNSELKKVKIIEQGGGETIVFSSDGTYFYGSAPNGSITKYNIQTGEASIFVNLSRPLGITLDNEGNLIAADSVKGIYKVTPDKKVTLMIPVEGGNLGFPDDVAVAKNGDIYFSDATHLKVREEMKYHDVMARSRLSIAASAQTGRLLKYDPKINKLTTLIDGIVFANGVSLSHDEDFVLVSGNFIRLNSSIKETGKYRIHRYWLSGSKAGTKDILVENLPGHPDGISQGSNSTFWIALAAGRNPILDFAHPYKELKELILMVPEWLVPVDHHIAAVQIDRDGKILRILHDQDAEIPVLSAVTEHQGKLYLGNVLAPRVAVKMKTVKNQQIEDFFQKFLSSREKKKTRFGSKFETYKPIIIYTLLFIIFISFVSSVFYLGNSLNQTFFYQDVRIGKENKATTIDDSKSTPQCQHTIQGKQWITDSEGFVCKRRDLNPITRCCKTIQRTENERYSCNNCNETASCCSIYEYCVSCCMKPETYSSIRKHYDNERLFGSASVNKSPHAPANSFLASDSSFEYCQATCRTNSKSILFLNKYKNEDLKYCFGIEAAPLQAKPDIDNSSSVEEEIEMSPSIVKVEDKYSKANNLHGDSGYDDMNADASHRFNIVIGNRISSSSSLKACWYMLSIIIIVTFY